MAKDDEIVEELRRIRMLLEPKPAPVPTPRPQGIWAEFVDFISKYKVLGMAVAFIIGLYLGALVQALVGDLIMPIIQFIVPGIPWEERTLGPFRIGHFLGAFAVFVIVLFIVFMLVKMSKKWGLE